MTYIRYMIYNYEWLWGISLKIAIFFSDLLYISAGRTVESRNALNSNRFSHLWQRMQIESPARIECCPYERDHANKSILRFPRWSTHGEPYSRQACKIPHCKRPTILPTDISVSDIGIITELKREWYTHIYITEFQDVIKYFFFIFIILILRFIILIIY